MFAAPHDLSQRTTSFIASQHQGIHRIPLRHLIALITNAHRSAATTHPTGKCKHPPAVRGIVKALISSKDQFCFKHIREPCGQAKPTTEMLAGSRGWKPHNPLTECVSSLRCQTERNAHRASRNWYAEGRPAPAIAPSGGARRDRTDDLMLAKHALSQLSYGPETASIE